MALARGEAVGGDDVLEDLAALLFAEFRQQRAEPAMVVGLDAQAPLPLRVLQVLVAPGQLALLHAVGVVGGDPDVQRHTDPLAVRGGGLRDQVG
eukprot:20379-Eustigmatos_ZCMA.PRE.1